ncbi:MAG: glycogen debranching protein [Microbacterium sp.]|uniref:amylo-alpha-1,6-glucosidase n=1 Tax=Microbacterium sp. TaxID=51671 RepID=UPI0039E60E98
MTMHDLPSFDIRHVPFSRRGAWLGVSPVVAAHRTHRLLHLVSHRTGMHAVLSLSPLVAGAAIDADVRADPASLAWHLPGGGVVRAAFEPDGAMRIRGTAGSGMILADATSELTPFTGVYLFRDPLDGSAVFTSYETGCRYRVTPVAARLDLEGAEALGAADRRVIVDGGDRDWEIAVEEFDTARPPYSTSRGFDDLVAQTRAEFAEYLDAIAPWRSERTPAAALAGYVLWASTVSAAGFLQRESVLMSKHWMDKVWSWDHCFNALALVPGLDACAWDQFMVPFDHQESSGALPDSVAHSERLYNFVKPPIHGWALQRMRRAGLRLDATRLRIAYDRLSRWTRFWLDSRRMPGNALPSYQHGNDSGWDNSTLFDRDRVVEAPDLVAFLLLQLDALVDLAAELGEDATSWRTAAELLRDAWTDRLWRDGFTARGVWSGAASKRTSLLTLIPLVASAHLDPEVVDVLAADVRRFLTPWGLATETVDSADYQPDGYWRGPIWAPSTLLIEDGLRTGGHIELANEVSARFRRLCEASGFAENFDALTGEGLRDRAYTWTAAVYLVLARDAV